MCVHSTLTLMLAPGGGMMHGPRALRSSAAGHKDRAGERFGSLRERVVIAGMRTDDEGVVAEQEAVQQAARGAVLYNGWSGRCCSCLRALHMRTWTARDSKLQLDRPRSQGPLLAPTLRTTVRVPPMHHAQVLERPASWSIS